MLSRITCPSLRLILATTSGKCQDWAQEAEVLASRPMAPSRPISDVQADIAFTQKQTFGLASMIGSTAPSSRPFQLALEAGHSNMSAIAAAQPKRSDRSVKRK